MKTLWIVGSLIVGGILSLGCAQTKSLARKERLPASLLQAASAPIQAENVSSVLKPGMGTQEYGSNNGASSLATAMPNAPDDPRTGPPAINAAYTGTGDPRIQYVSLTEPAGGDQPPIPALPESIPPAYSSIPPAVSSDRPMVDERVRTQRMRQLAQRVQQSMPDRLDDFMREVRQGAAQGNWDEVMASWEVALEFAGTLTVPAGNSVEHRVSSLSDALKRDVPPSTRSAEPPARLTSVATATPSTHAPELDDRREPSSDRSGSSTTSALAPSLGERIVPYRPADDRSAPLESRSTSTGVDFVSMAQEMGRRTSSEGGDPYQWKVYSRLLYAMAGQRDRALDPIEGMDPADRRFWRSYIYALDRYFDVETVRRPAARATLTSVALRESMEALADRADLEISNPIFCKAVHSFGHYDEFDRYEFRAGDGVVVYWEVKQFVSAESAEGFRTRMKAEFEIVDAQGNRRHRFEQKFKDDVCRRKRSDYFNVVVFEWPSDLTPGDYSLRVTVTDIESQKVAEKKQSLRIVR
ncbi:hypothetical protein K2X85_05970 [bacterium]|nr:hypothetical protein [bacterium]